jgi:hypothetical protein
MHQSMGLWNRDRHCIYRQLVSTSEASRLGFTFTSSMTIVSGGKLPSLVIQLYLQA